VLIGIAQEKASVWKSWPRRGQEKARHPHMDRGGDGYINHFYFYLWMRSGGGAFWKTTPMRPIRSGLAEWPQWAKRQLEKAGIGYEPG